MAIGFSIKAVAVYAGLTPHVIRAWEKRYGILAPERSEAGRRVYTAAEADHLRLLALLVRGGHTISRLAKASVEELRDLESALAERDDPLALPAAGREKAAAKAKVRAYQVWNRIASFQPDSLLDDLYALRRDVPPREVLLQVVHPLLVRIGDKVARAELSVADEHAVSAVLKVFLGDLFFQLQRSGPLRESRHAGEDAKTARKRKPHLVFATVEGDLHEFGVMIGGCLAGIHGFRSTMLGSNMPALALADACRMVKADIVVLSRTRLIEERPDETFLARYLAELDGRMPAGAKLWLAGNIDTKLEPIRRKRPVEYLPTFPHFEQLLLNVSVP